jgi:hypothetical protein
MPRLTALIVPVPEAEPYVSDVRLVHDGSAALGVPAHITILFPFVDGADLDEEAVEDVLAPFTAFAFELDRVGRWDPGSVWLHPEPSTPFSELITAVWQRWPAHPPYEGAYDVVIPHLTVSEVPIDFDPPLPIACVAREVTLIEQAVGPSAAGIRYGSRKSIAGVLSSV